MSVKSVYGEVITPRAFAREMLLTTLPAHLFKNPDLKWLDAGAGQGCFSAVLREILNETLATVLPPGMDAAMRDKHIVTKMLHMVELNPDNVAHHLRPMFGPGANIYEADYTSWNGNACSADVIIGNPPFNCGGAIKVPTNAAADKHNDGRTIWPQFVMKNLQILRANQAGGGFMCILVPSIWMKPADKSGIFAALISRPDPARVHTITRLRCFTSLQANRIFRSGGGAQTPCCYFSLETRPHLSPSSHSQTNASNAMKYIELVDEISGSGSGSTGSCKYVQYSVDPPRPIPLNCAGIINKLTAHMPPHPGAHVRVLKTNMPPKGTTFGPPDMVAPTPEYPHPCVHSCILDAHTKEPRLVIRYSSRPCAYAGVPKIILAHKMYGHPVIDISGVYGISNRDNYVVEIERDVKTGAAPDAEWARQMQRYLSSPVARLVYDATRYRMQFLERYAFELLSMPPPSLHCLEPEELEYIVKKYGS
jgi:hypothetical protein